MRCLQVVRRVLVKTVRDAHSTVPFTDAAENLGECVCSSYPRTLKVSGSRWSREGNQNSNHKPFGAVS